MTFVKCHKKWVNDNKNEKYMMNQDVMKILFTL